LSKTYDVVVVGAGMGGLSAATNLAKHGRKVLLLERHNVPGGYATTFVRGDYEFEVALHELSGMGTEAKPGPLHRYLGELGVLDHIELVRLDTVYRSIFPEHDLTLPVGWDGYIDVLCQAFPHDADGIRRFLGRIRKLGQEMEHFDKMLNWSGGLDIVGLVARLPANSQNILRYVLSNFGAILERDVTDPAARAIISQFWGYIGLPPSKASFLYLGGCIATYINNGPCHVTGGSQALSSAFVAQLEAFGGEIRLNCGVESITTRDGAVTGVITEGGEEIRADWVISNLDPVATCRDLIGAEFVSPKFWKGQKAHRVGISTFSLYLGLAQSPEELGITDHAVFLNDSYDIEDHFRRTHTLGDPGVVALTSYSGALPEMTPPGTSMAMATTAMYGDQWLDVAPEAYVETKMRIAESMFATVEASFPGMRAATEIVEVGTPVTNMRYGGQTDGAVYGTEQVPYNSTVFRTPHAGPLHGLFFVGASTQPGAGFEPTMTSGKLASSQLLAADRREG
jgi:prolycopene isomerase